MMRQKLDSPVAVTRSSLPPLEEYVDMLKPLWESAWLTNMGDYHEQFKEQLKEYLMIPELELFVNGHMALELALQALDLKGEVITTPFSFASTTHAIVRNGLTPVFCDINPVDYTLDAEQLESRITGDLRCGPRIRRDPGRQGGGGVRRCVDVQFPCYQGVSQH